MALAKCFASRPKTNHGQLHRLYQHYNAQIKAAQKKAKSLKYIFCFSMMRCYRVT